MSASRDAFLHRKTTETDIQLRLCLDGDGLATVNTGIPFLDHMLTLFAQHGLFDLEVTAAGDNQVDYHHTVEDLGLVLGAVLSDALQNREGIERYGFFILPMDEVLVRTAIDLGGRPFLDYRVEAPEMRIRDFNLSLLREFFQAFAYRSGANLHIRLEAGSEPHHIAEGIFKSFARALCGAVRRDPRRKGKVPSTKGTLTR